MKRIILISLLFISINAIGQQGFQYSPFCSPLAPIDGVTIINPETEAVFIFFKVIEIEDSLISGMDFENLSNEDIKKLKKIIVENTYGGKAISPAVESQILTPPLSPIDSIYLNKLMQKIYQSPNYDNKKMYESSYYD